MVLSCGLYFGQLSKISEIDKVYQSTNKQLSEKYKDVYSLERIREEDENNMKRLAAYESAIATMQKEEPKVDSASLLEEVSKAPEYEKGLDGFRTLLVNNFDSSLLASGSGTLKTNAQFLIDRKGNISHVEAEGDSREFNLLTIITLYKLANKGKWKPAENEGIPVQYLFRLPLTMKFE